MSQTIRFSAVGDTFALKRLCKQNSSLPKIREQLCSTDVRFTNLETPMHSFEAELFPSRFSGGDWAVTSPRVLTDLGWLGFNLIGAPNNHSLDWGHNGILQTARHLEEADMAFSGIGRDMAAAMRPAYLETPGGRVGLVSFNTTFDDWHMAGEARRDLHGRPGIFGVEYLRAIPVSDPELAVLEQVHERVPLEGDGWLEEEGLPVFCLGQRKYVRASLVGGTKKPACTKTRQASLELLERSIQEAVRQADLVVVSCHSHERLADDPHQAAEFQEELAHFCIRQGARVFIAHGPHVLRGIQLYEGGLILHGLGNFFYQCELIPRSPAEFYSKFAPFSPQACTMDVYDYRVNNGGILGETNPDYFQSVIAQFSFEGNILQQLSLLPVSLQFQENRARKGTPIIAEGALADQILQEMQEMSAAYDVKLRRERDRLVLGESPGRCF